MSVTIEKIGLVVPGQIVRKYDTEADETTLTLTGDQVQFIHDATGSVVGLFAPREYGGAQVPHERPNPIAVDESIRRNATPSAV